MYIRTDEQYLKNVPIHFTFANGLWVVIDFVNKWYT